MHYLEILVIVGSLGAMMFGMLRFMLRDIQNDINLIKVDIRDIKEELKAHEKRIDHLYQICIEMLGDRHKG